MKAVILLALLALAGAEYVYPGSPAYINDNNVLQYALTLENLEYAFYEGALAAFPNATIGDIDRELFEIIEEHEKAHVAAISQILRDRGVVPVTRCNYTFDFSSEDVFIATATALERTGVSAYDAAIKFLTEPDLITLAAGVAAVEARHASLLGGVFDDRPFPNVTDIALNPADILSIAGPFFVSGCAQLTPIVNPANLLKTASSLRNQTVTNTSLAYLNDNNVLQYALTLEHLEAQFYANALSQISAMTMVTAGGPFIRPFIELIAAQEAAHVLYLQTFLRARGATPVPACTYQNIDFSNNATGFMNFLQTGIALENVGTSAYIGAHTLLTDEGLLQIAATVSTVEARHTAFLRFYVSAMAQNQTLLVPFPNVVDPALTPAEVLVAAAGFLANPTACITFTPPVPADNFRPNISMPITSSSTTSAPASSSSNSAPISSSSTTTSGNISSTASISRTRTGTAENSEASMLFISMAVIAALALLF